MKERETRKQEKPSPGLQPEQQPQGGGVNEPELHPTKDRFPQKEQEKSRRSRSVSDDEKAAFQKAFRNALRRLKPDQEEQKLFLIDVFGATDGLNTEEIRERCHQRREKRAKRAAQYTLRQERKRQQRDDVHVFPPPPKKE